MSKTSPPEALMSFVKVGLKIKDVSAGGKHSLYLTEEGQVFASGSNDYGQLGIEGGNLDEPQIVSLVKSVQVCCGLVHSHVLSAGG